jgi:hypothetical protein
VALVLQDLGGEVLGSAAEGEGAVLYRLREAKVCEFEVSVCGDEYVFGFEVPVDDIAGVEVFEDGDDVRCVEAACGGWYAALWGSNMPSSRRWVKSSPPGTYSRNM